MSGAVTVRDAATVMVIRDGPSADSGATAVEVVLLQRSLKASFVGGAHVFPGGVVDPSDHSPAAAACVYGLDDTRASSILGLASGGLGFWVAAVRETFEEAGILLAVKRDTFNGLSTEELGSPAFVAARAAIHDGSRQLSDVLVEHGLVIDASRIRPWSRWVTPVGSPRRYDTRFFVAQAPVAAEPAHDGRETVASEWSSPIAALDRFQRSEIQLIFPTVKSLEALARYGSTVEALAARRGADHSE
jgi:8-oxo-dGTP pyrophosphatase MutT (NUDIX family)